MIKYHSPILTSWQVVYPERDVWMKIIKKKRLFCCLFAAVFVFSCFTYQSITMGQTDTIVFSTFEDLQSFCDETADFSGGTLLCEEADLVISEDLEIPSGRTVTFRSFTVPEGITLTVMQDAEIRTYGFTVQGELINRGTVFQGELSDEGDGEVQDTEIAAHIPGHVENKGEMTLTDVYGKRNIRWYGSHFTMIETDRYGKIPDTESKEPELQTTASPVPENTPQPVPSGNRRRQVLKFFDRLEMILPKAAFFLVIALFGFVIKVALSEKKKEKTSGQTSQLDDLLKSGWIDRKQYNELKKKQK